MWYLVATARRSDAAMKVQVTRTKTAETFYVAKTYRDRETGRSTSKIVRRLGTRSELERMLPPGTDVMGWAREEARRMTLEERELTRRVTVSYDPTRQMALGERHAFNCGYLFLQSIYSALGLPQICRDIASRSRADYDLDAVLSRLVYGRILEPSSKRATYEFSQKLLEQPAFDAHQVYRALSVLAGSSEEIQRRAFEGSRALVKRHCQTLFYDCTNYYFEITEEDGFRRYGPSKEHRPNPIVGMGLMMDRDGLPVAFDLYPGNESEQPTLIPLEERLEGEFGLSKFIVCTDAGLSSAANRAHNSRGSLQFVTTVSLRGQRKEVRDWARDPSGWLCAGEAGTFDLDQVRKAADDPLTPERTRRALFPKTFYKTMWTSLKDPATGEELGQNLIVTFSLRYRAYQASIRKAQVERARKACEDGTAKRHRKGPKDPMRFVASTSVTGEGEVAERCILSVDEGKVEEEASWDGLYGLATSLDDEDVLGIVKVASGRWEVEECFRIMKGEFRARPVFLSRRDRIEAHFLTCFLALLVYRILERRLGGRWTCPEIVDTLRGMQMEEVRGEGYRPLYVRTELTDALHEAFGFRTDFEIVPQGQMRKILRKTRQKASVATKKRAGGDSE
jgi:hypothetical protein